MGARLSRLLAALSLLALVLGLAGLSHAAAGTTSTTPGDQLAGEGESWPEYTVRALENDAAAAGALGSLSPTYTAGRGEDPARQDFVAGAADFAVSEDALTATEASAAASAGITPAYVPYALGTVAIVAAVQADNQHGGQLVTGIRLTLPTIAKIFAHYITSWNDPEILAENPGLPILKSGLAVPSPIVTVVRRDSSSTNTALVKTLLADPQARPYWEGYAKSLGQAPDATPDTWPADDNGNTIGVTSGSRGAINAIVNLDPVTGKPIQGTPAHALGYVGPEWATQFGVPLVAVQNHATPPAFVLPTDAGAVTSAFSSPGVSFDASTNLYSIDYANVTGTGSYPVPLPSYLVVPVTGAGAGKAAALASFVRWVLGGAGQADVTSTGMTPVPQAVQTSALAVASALDQESAPSTTSASSTSTSTASAGTSASAGSTAAGAASSSSTTAKAAATGGAGRLAARSVAAAGGGSSLLGSGSGAGAQLPFTGAGLTLAMGMLGLALAGAAHAAGRRVRLPGG